MADRESHDLLEALEAARSQLISNYKKRPDLPLIEFNDQMVVTAHASPDAGWPTLQPFLARIKKQLTIGMYEFTAPHIVNACTASIKPNSRHVSLVLQNRDEQKKGTTANDLTEQETVDRLTAAAGKRLSFAWASVSGPNRLFATSYHSNPIITIYRERELAFVQPTAVRPHQRQRPDAAPDRAI